ncbi:hypothetical protein AAMO2058_000504200 [Amorphochlora amoebiformis]
MSQLGYPETRDYVLCIHSRRVHGVTSHCITLKLLTAPRRRAKNTFSRIVMANPYFYTLAEEASQEPR